MHRIIRLEGNIRRKRSSALAFQKEDIQSFKKPREKKMNSINQILFLEAKYFSSKWLINTCMVYELMF